MVEKDILPLTTLAGFVFDGYQAVLQTTANYTLTIGETYYVVWDGETYECVGQDASIVVPGGVGLGDFRGFGGTGNDEPFTLGVAGGVTMYATTDDNTSHEARIYQIIDGETGGDTPDDTVVIPLGSYEFAEAQAPSGATARVNITLNFVLEPWRKYRVSWNGAETTLIARCDGEGDVYLGNLSIAERGEDTGEAFYITRSTDTWCIVATRETGDAHQLGVWRSADIGVILRDYLGAESAHYGVERLEVPTTDGGTAEYVHEDLVPEPVEQTVELDFSGGDMAVTPDTGKVFSGVSIPAPVNLIPANIAEGVDIAGIIGTMAAGGARMACGTFTGADAPTTVEHSLGATPDMVFVTATGNWSTSNSSLGTTDRLMWTIGMSEKLGKKFQSDQGFYYGVYYAAKRTSGNVYVGTSGTVSSPIESVAGMGRCIHSANETSFTVGPSGFYQIPAKNVPYYWLAIAGLTA